jgi:hypothetical protein
MSEVKTNKITSLASNNDITLDPDGTGDVVVASGNIGVGQSTTRGKLTVKTANATTSDSDFDVVGLAAETSMEVANKTATLLAGYDTAVYGVAIGYSYVSPGYNLIFGTNDNTSGSPIERLRIDASGNVLVGTTDAAPRNLSSGSGIRLGYDGSIEAAKATNAVARLNRTGDDGEVIQIRRDGSTKGTVGINGGNLFIHSANVGLVYQNAQDRILPCTSSGAARDNVIDLGEGGARFDDIFATNGSIQTSDQNEKQDIASLTTAEMTAAKAISKLFKTFKWQDKVAAKGDAARTHTGVIAQEVQTAMTDAGLDASNYAFWCSDTWWETSTDVAAVEADEEAGIEAQDAYTRIDTYHTADEAPEGATQRTRLGIRYAELMAFVGAATEQRLADIETRLTALEG